MKMRDFNVEWFTLIVIRALSRLNIHMYEKEEELHTYRVFISKYNYPNFFIISGSFSSFRLMHAVSYLAESQGRAEPRTEKLIWLD